MSFNGCSIIFHNVLEWYEPDKLILCQFSMKDDALRVSKQENDCYVGVFHVGWDSLAANITKKSFSLIETVSEKLFQVRFEGEELPDANSDEFYQFCFYNVKSEVVFGASCPFQICDRGDAIEPFVVCTDDGFLSPRREGESKESMNDWMKENNIEIADDDDEEFGTIMVVKKSDRVEEGLSKFQKENEYLLQQVEAMKVESEKSLIHVNHIQSESYAKDQRIEILEERVSESEKVINHLNNRIKDIKSDLEQEHDIKIRELAVEKENLESSRAKAHFEYNLMKSEFKDKENKLSNEIVALTNALDIEKNSCKLLENEHRTILEKFGQITDAHGKEIEETKQMEAKIVETMSLLKVEKQKNVGLLNEMDNLHEAVELVKAEMTSKVTEFETKEEILKQEIEILKDQLEKEQGEYNSLRTSYISVKTKENNLTEAIEQAKIEKSDLEMQLQKICQVKTSEIESLTKQIEEQGDLIRENDSQLESLLSKIDEKDDEIIKMKYLIECKEEESKYTMEELKIKVEQLQTQLVIEKEPKPVSMTKSEGSYYALQIAYSFIQKQLKQFKAENEELRKLMKSGQNSTGKENVLKENEDLKLRLQFGKQAFENQFKECEKAKTELKSFKRSLSIGKGDLNEVYEQSLKREKEQLQAEIVDLKDEMLKKEKIEKEMWVKMDEVNDKMKQYEDNMKLVRDENKLLRSQVSALLEGATTSNTIRKKFDPELGDVIYHPPSSQKQNEIVYPPSMNRIDRPNSAWSPTAAQVKRNYAPPTQVMPHREPTVPTASLTLRGRGTIIKGEKHAPTFQCPVCQFDFPTGYSEVSASAHVNSHFRE